MEEEDEGEDGEDGEEDGEEGEEGAFAGGGDGRVDGFERSADGGDSGEEELTTAPAGAAIARAVHHDDGRGGRRSCARGTRSGDAHVRRESQLAFRAS
eukprot:4392504-Prymnesium_polylepis.1